MAHDYPTKSVRVLIPFAAGGGQAVPAIIGNEIQMIFESLSTAIGHICGGRIRGLGIASRGIA